MKSVRGRLRRGMEGNLEEFSCWAAAMAMSSIARVALLPSVSFLITCVSSIAEEKMFLRFLFPQQTSEIRLLFEASIVQVPDGAKDDA
eukprot:scaffold421187_cov100-Attheya_sp.AAC.1